MLSLHAYATPEKSFNCLAYQVHISGTIIHGKGLSVGLSELTGHEGDSVVGADQLHCAGLQLL